ncbi:MAG TPA: AmmeMemoRadiSam system protein B, partial [Promineifilum sp.]|nr:AmmeMemoRadiSam system protein B [Promineifilum sp.]
MPVSEKPQLRVLDFQPVFHRGERMWLLRDPWQLSDRQLIVPQAIAQMLLLCDGTRTAAELRAEIAEELGIDIPFEVVRDALSQLDQVYLLHN